MILMLIVQQALTFLGGGGGIPCCNQPSPTSVGSLPVAVAVPVRPSAHAIAPSWAESWHQTRLEAPAAARALL